MDVFQSASHFKNYDDRTNVFLRQIHIELGRLGSSPTVLDIGCGEGIGLESNPQMEIAKRVGTYWGVEPDSSVQPASCFSRVWKSTLEDADVPSDSVDFAYSQMVLEHVASPRLFLDTLARVLKPGGIFLAMTVNQRSAFGRISSLCNRLGIQDAVLRISRGRQMVEEYHYPAVYRLCSDHSFRTHGVETWFSEFRTATLEADEWLVYFPKGTRWGGKILTRLFQRNPKNYTWLMVRMMKRSQAV
jgi:SAM-dependent methyltransferase